MAVENDILDIARRWNARIPENGAVALFKSREERDAFLRGEAT